MFRLKQFKIASEAAGKDWKVCVCGMVSQINNLYDEDKLKDVEEKENLNHESYASKKIY